MPLSTDGNRSVMLFAESLSSYVVGLALPSFTARALRTFLCHFPHFQFLSSDYGAEYSRIFTQELACYGIEHQEGVPGRSQIQGQAEVSIKLLKLCLQKLIGVELFIAPRPQSGEQSTSISNNTVQDAFVVFPALFFK